MSVNNIIRIVQNIVDKVIPILGPLCGFPSEVYYPLRTDSVYGSKDNQYDYPQVPSYTGNLLFGGSILAEGSASDATLDNYGDSDVFVIITGTQNIPCYSKIVTQVGGRKAVFRVKNIVGPPGTVNIMYKKLLLIPMETRLG